MAKAKARERDMAKERDTVVTGIKLLDARMRQQWKTSRQALAAPHSRKSSLKMPGRIVRHHARKLITAFAARAIAFWSLTTLLTMLVNSTPPKPRTCWKLQRQHGYVEHLKFLKPNLKLFKRQALWSDRWRLRCTSASRFEGMAR